MPTDLQLDTVDEICGCGFNTHLICTVVAVVVSLLGTYCAL